jgi:short-subunit dehydrogenase
VIVNVTVAALCPGSKASSFQDKADLGRSAWAKGKKLPTPVKMAALGYEAMHPGQQVCIRGLVDSIMAQSVRITPCHVATRVVKHWSNPTA